MNISQKKQLIRLIGIFIFVLAGTVHLYGQSFSQSALMNREWRHQGEGQTFYHTMSFTDKGLIMRIFLTDSEEPDAESKGLYYLSYQIVDEFQHELVGKNTSGRYIVRLVTSPATGEERVEVHEILKLTGTMLRVRHLPRGMVIGGGAILEFTAVAP